RAAKRSEADPLPQRPMDRSRDPPTDAASGPIRGFALSRARSCSRRRCRGLSRKIVISLVSPMSANPNLAQPIELVKAKKPGMSRAQKLLFFLTAWLICLMPFLFWWNTWFGRKLTDQQLTEYLHNTKKPRHIQQALVQVGERISRHEAAATQWYPELVRLAGDPVEEVRNTDAWVMGQDTSGAGFHEALLKMISDPSPMVRGNAALSLVRFGDSTGRPQIVALLQPAQIASPGSGRVVDSDRPGTAIH